MGRDRYVFSCLVLALAVFSGCASERSAKESTPVKPVRETIKGTAQIILTETNQTDKALSAGGPSVYIWQGTRRYRLFLKTPVEMEGGKEYVAEGIEAQKVIDELGDPDEGRNGYPLVASCKHVVRMVWPNMAMDVTDGFTNVLRDRVKRYPARPVFLVAKIEPVVPKEGEEAKKKAAEEKEVPEVTVAPEKQMALKVEGPGVLAAPLWEPAGGTARCKVLIDADGKIAELQTGSQLCEIVPWSQFRYKPTVQRGHPVNVKTEVEVRFEARKAGPST